MSAFQIRGWRNINSGKRVTRRDEKIFKRASRRLPRSLYSARSTLVVRLSPMFLSWYSIQLWPRRLPPPATLKTEGGTGAVLNPPARSIGLGAQVDGGSLW